MRVQKNEKDNLNSFIFVYYEKNHMFFIFVLKQSKYKRAAVH
jgi:hypothetical protein